MNEVFENRSNYDAGRSILSKLDNDRMNWVLHSMRMELYRIEDGIDEMCEVEKSHAGHLYDRHEMLRTTLNELNAACGTSDYDDHPALD